MTRVKLRIWTSTFTADTEDDPIEFWVEVDGGARLRQVDGPGCGTWLQAGRGIHVELDAVEHEEET